MFIRVSLRGMLSLTWVDTLRRDHNVGFLAGRLICIVLSLTVKSIGSLEIFLTALFLELNEVMTFTLELTLTVFMAGPFYFEISVT